MAKRVKRRKRARKGDGTVFWRRGQYLARKTIRGVRYEGYGRTEAEARADRDRKISLTPSSKVTLAEWLDRWLPVAKLREQTRDVYKRHIDKRLKPDLGHIQVAKLTAFDVEEAAQKWGAGVSAGTVRVTLTVLSAAMKAAKRARLVTENVLSDVEKPAAAEAAVDPFTPAELRLIIKTALTEPRWRVFAACGGTGCRIGEALGLPPGAYDAGTGRVAITRTRTRSHGTGPTKSRRGTRTITVPAIARPTFLAGIPTCDYAVANKRFHQFLKRLGLRDRNPHQLRHSVASHLVAAGVPLADIAAYLGTTLAVLVKTYVHPVGNDPSAALDRLFSGGR
jgi:integrase